MTKVRVYEIIEYKDTLLTLNTSECRGRYVLLNQYNALEAEYRALKEMYESLTETNKRLYKQRSLWARFWALWER